MKTYTLLIAALILTLTACNPNRVYETHESNFSNYRWDKATVLTFKPTIEDASQTYRVYLALRHVYGFQFENFAVNLTRTSPSGIVTNKKVTFPVIGPDKKYLSVCDGDYCDLETVIEEVGDFSEVGTYVYTVQHIMSVPEVPNVMEFGLIIEKHEVAQ
jgi:gliding motility-associated lipoprotein GldH